MSFDSFYRHVRPETSFAREAEPQIKVLSLEGIKYVRTTDPERLSKAEPSPSHVARYGEAVQARFMTVTEVADLLAVHADTVRRRIRTGELRAVRDKGVMRVAREHVDEWVAAHQAEPVEGITYNVNAPVKRSYRW
jgi:excisionase family DNA binding protein